MRGELRKRIAALEEARRAFQTAPGIVLRFVRNADKTLPAFEQKHMKFEDYQFGPGGKLTFIRKGKCDWRRNKNEEP